MRPHGANEYEQMQNIGGGRLVIPRGVCSRGQLNKNPGRLLNVVLLFRFVLFACSFFNNLFFLRLC